MIERNGYPAGVPCWVDTDQPDVEAAVAFYGGMFGWELEERMPAGAPVRYFVGRLHGRDVGGIGSQPEGAPLGTPAWRTYVWVDSADEAAAKAQEAGGSVPVEPFDIEGAGRMAVLADTEGASFGVWQARQHRGAQLVNEPGSWNFSELNTRDPEAATAFYGTVFGWEANPVDFGGDGGAMLRAPGYGDHLATLDPGIRERQSADSAPEGFEDAVAWLMPIADDHSPPHWSITFAVDDADAAAERAARLGGEVLVPPFDAPWVRMTVLRDPQGAEFTASRYMPPG